MINLFQGIYSEHLTLKEVVSLLGFKKEQLNQLAGKLSGGQKRLFAFSLCLISKPEILFLDEPTAGMDTSTRQRFWEIISHLKKSGKTIIYSSHYIEEVEHTADRIIVLNKGKLIRDTTPYAMRLEENSKQITLPIKYKSYVENLTNIFEVKKESMLFNFKLTLLIRCGKIFKSKVV